jgi:hypothetical protein
MLFDNPMLSWSNVLLNAVSLWHLLRSLTGHSIPLGLRFERVDQGILFTHLRRRCVPPSN